MADNPKREIKLFIIKDGKAIEIKPHTTIGAGMKFEDFIKCIRPHLKISTRYNDG